MSDFDKEAEREKLREKFEKEEAEREATEQMSELLLKGATMTNAHCSTCGDPVFRYDGQEFCPTCQKPITRGENEQDEDGDTADGDHIEVADPSEEARVQFGDQEDEPEPSADAAGTAGEQTPDASGAGGVAGSTDGDTRLNADAAPSETEAVSNRQPTADTQIAASRSTPAGGNDPSDPTPSVSTRTAELPEEAATDLTEAKRLLAQTARQFAQRAADSQDPRDAREHLQAAREAGAALDAMDF
ncbi:Sjogren's syndrome/scleroderma autoantigen 1 family protein [Haloarcula sp. GH36]|uniref:Sjogren's syndrome/scleroderma autoantigen 1 family protein n=1 Tax=Haloarcula montana TaxID=3111776 RepID=UPI002D76B3D0|nr:Sjogren's syndrome/scleroderma autoantigen 1 family protein [Haloarcula sp. GH36]